MSESEEATTVEPGKFLLNMGDTQYDLNVIGKALGFARDFVIGEDVKNAAKNLSDCRFSPLAVAIEEALELLRDLFDKHAVKTDAELAEPADQS